MQKDQLKFLIAFGLIGVAGLGAMVASKHTSASEGGSISVPASGVSSSQSPAQIKIAQIQGSKHSAQVRLASASAEQNRAENDLRSAIAAVNGIDVQANQARQRVVFAKKMLQVKQHVYERVRDQQQNAAGTMAAMGVNPPDFMTGAHAEVMQAMQNVTSVEFEVNQQLQTLSGQRAQCVLQAKNAELALENAKRNVTLAQNEVAAAEKQLALLMAQMP